MLPTNAYGSKGKEKYLAWCEVTQAWTEKNCWQDHERSKKAEFGKALKGSGKHARDEELAAQPPLQRVRTALGKYSTCTTVLDLQVHSYCKSQLRKKQKN